MKSLKKYVMEAVGKSVNKDAEKLAKYKEKIEKITKLIEKKNVSLQKIINQYKKNSEICKLISGEVFDNFKNISFEESKRLADERGTKKLEYKYNYGWYEMYTKKSEDIMLKHGIAPGTPYKEHEKNWNAIEADSDNRTLKDAYYDYFEKAYDIFSGIINKELELKELEEQIASISKDLEIKDKKTQSLDDLFKRVPQLDEFINKIGEQQYKFLTEKNAKLKKLWDEFNAKEAKLDEIYGDEWAARCNRKEDGGEGYAKYQELNKQRPKQRCQTEAQIKRDIENWTASERKLLASRIMTEFGEIKSTELHIGADGNVNGTIVGSLKTAKIETIFAGGYNIQRLHTRLLVHEK